MDKKLLIIGAGQYGQVVREMAVLNPEYKEVAFVDDSLPIAIGKINELESFYPEWKCAIVAIGNPEIKKEITRILIQIGFEIVNVIHPSAYISPSAKIGQGCVIEAMAVINTATILGSGVFVSPGAVINHNCCIMDFSHINCNAVIEAGCVVPEGVKIESGSVFAKKM